MVKNISSTQRALYKNQRAFRNYTKIKQTLSNMFKGTQVYSSNAHSAILLSFSYLYNCIYDRETLFQSERNLENQWLH